MNNRKRIGKYIISFDSKLGEGTLGKVYIGYSKQQPDKLLAVKVIDTSKIQKESYTNIAIMRQFEVHKQLSHHNIVSLQEYKVTRNHIYIFQELCNGGNLAGKLKEIGIFTEKQVIFCASQVVGGFTQLVKKGIIHRDLKLQNLVLHEQSIKICDFGYSKQIKNQKQFANSVVGSPLYACPQICKCEKYSSKCDVWSFGVMLYEMLHNKFPWGSRYKPITTYGLLRLITTQPLVFQHQFQNKHLQRLIQDCLKIQQADRLSWLQIFQHDLFQGQFDRQVSQIRFSMEHAGQLLQKLKNDITLQKLVGYFLLQETQSLDFSTFEQLIKQFIPHAPNEQIGYMYQFFDKDTNGVIDLQQLVNTFQIWDSRLASLLNKLIIQDRMLYKQLKNQQLFRQKSSKYKEFSPQIVEQVWNILSYINIKNQ